MFLVFYCPECRYSGAVPEEQVSPAAIFCGPCNTERATKVEMRRDFIAEGGILDAPLSDDGEGQTRERTLVDIRDHKKLETKLYVPGMGEGH